PLPRRFAAASLLAALAVIGGGCATVGEPATRVAPGPAMGETRTNAEVAPATGKLLTSVELRTEIPTAIIGDRCYAEVNSAWLPQWYRTFRAKLFKIGLARWDDRFDCNRIADFYSNLAQAYFALEMFYSKTPAQALAMGPFWYVRGDGKGCHAIVQVLTERGRVFIDPHTGEEMKLSPAERQSGYVQIF
ncbi:MAG: hypothetical protein JWQ62_2879, partial [Lacunisphaera sp.]|nr:hypothetical protein [Lacunisphaera sp.]